ncbi:hypothetical protein [Rhizobium sp. RAF56]|uniref:hypothetical protein n=1 Tax=Rhizobium sp. RAF56 TaxID=3233062 RepID=UPI003F9AAB61
MAYRQWKKPTLTAKQRMERSIMASARNAIEKAERRKLARKAADIHEQDRNER